MAKIRFAVVLIGPPGSGKTTLARSLGARAGTSVVELGNLLEAEVRRETPLGRQIKPYRFAGELVPLELVKQVLSDELIKVDGQLVIFDGFPRSATQIGMFFQLLKEHELQLCAVLVLSVDFQTVLNRITGRRVCVNCGAVYNVHTQPPRSVGICDQCGNSLIQREDDRTEVVRKRFNIYERDTIPVVEFFRKEFGRLLWEDSTGTSLAEQLSDRVAWFLEKHCLAQES